MVCAVSLTVAAGSGRAATLTAVPMQGGMVMPMVSYHATDGMIHVMMPADRAATDAFAGEQSGRQF